jgi:radical SAM protein (TIGR01212 family)
MRQRFGGRVQKLAIDAGLTCPNRDGGVGRGGCTFCLNEAFSPSYCREGGSLLAQLRRAMDFHLSRGRKADYYLAYLQAGTNTYSDIEKLRDIYSELLSHPNISGLIVGTRPDCVNSEILDVLEDLSHDKYVALEYGIESVYDATLERVNRGHGFDAAIRAVAMTKERGLDVGGHFILGLPGERARDIVRGVARINALGLDFIKFHQLQIYRGTAMEREYATSPEEFIFAKDFGLDDYVDLVCDVLRHLDASVAVERLLSQAPVRLLSSSPLGGIRPDEFRCRVVERLNSLGAVQGDKTDVLFGF